MRAQRGPYNAESRRRSGAKQSRTERRERQERRALLRGQHDEPTERRFGILLQGAVAKQLGRLRVPHRLIDHRDDYARSERVELVVLDADGGAALAEFQYTLRRGIRGKIADFIRAATVRASRDVPRVYLEIEDRVGYALKPMADRVAHAVRDIANGLDRFAKRAEQGNVLGLALVLGHGRDVQILPMRLMRMIGTRARSMLEDLLAPPEPVPERVPEPPPEPTASTAQEPAPTRQRPPVIWPTPWFLGALANRLRSAFVGFVPSPVPAYASAQRRLPMRLTHRRR